MNDALRNIHNALSQLWDRSNSLFSSKKARNCPYCFNRVELNMTSEIKMAGRITKIPTCGNCSRQLPSDFFRIQPKSIAVVGGNDSGKSTYITVFCALLLREHTVLNSLGFFAEIINRDGKEWFEDNYDSLYMSGELLEGTRDISVPIVIKLHREGSSKVLFITLIDSPGEEFGSIDNLTTRHPNLIHADAILFLISPFSLRGIFKWLEDGDTKVYENYRNLQERSKTDDTAIQIISNLYELFLRRGLIKHNQKIPIPVCFGISRADIIEDLFSLIPNDDDAYAELHYINGDIKEASDAIEEFLTIDEVDTNLQSFINRYFSKKCFWPVSPLGSEPLSNNSNNGPGRVSGCENNMIEPHGVLYPIIWLLQQIKYLK